MDIIETIRLLKGDKKNLLQVSLQYIQYEKNNIFKDVAKIHLNSAEQALIAATTSNAPDYEIRVGIGHLRDSFNSYQVLLDRGNIILGFLYVKWDKITVTSIYLKLASIASVIALIYKNIGDESNYVSWKITAVDAAKSYLQDRPYAIRKWKDATTVEVSFSGAARSRVDNAKRLMYGKEVAFIDVFSKVMKEEI